MGHDFTRAAAGVGIQDPRSLSEIEFAQRRINELQTLKRL